jgi:preprotein translocase subunit SecG
VYPFFVALHVVLCLFLVAVVLLQPGKGGDVGAAFGGGGGSTIFGPRGPTNVLQQATTAVAVLFMVTSFTLAIYSNRSMRSNANVSEEVLRLQQEGAATDGAPTDGAPALEAAEPTPLVPAAP